MSVLASVPRGLRFTNLLYGSCTPLRKDHMTSYDCHMTRLTENRKGKDEDEVYVVRFGSGLFDSIP